MTYGKDLFESPENEVKDNVDDGGNGSCVVEKMSKQVLLLQKQSHGHDKGIEEKLNVGMESKVGAGVLEVLETGFKSLESSIAKQLDGVKNMMELEFRADVMENIKYGGGDLRGFFEGFGCMGEEPSGEDVQARLGLESQESMNGTALPPGDGNGNV